MSLILSIVIIIVLAMLFTWLAVRSAHAKRALVKWPGMILAGLLALVLALVGIVAAVGAYRVSAPRARAVPEVQITASPEMIAAGEQLAHLCAGCHLSTGKLPLDGGAESFLPGLLMTLYAPNLTPGGALQDWSDGEIIRAIREGVHQSGRALLLMPSGQFHAMSDADVRALVAYLRSQPAVERELPETEVNLLGAVLIGAGMFPTSVQPPITAAVEAPPEEATPAYGEYLVTISGCAECHGKDLRGGEPGGFVPAGPNLVALLPQWSAAGFIETINTGINPYGRTLSDEMPWRDYSAAFSDSELRAMYEYIVTRAEE